jgi:hypothetical protein
MYLEKEIKLENFLGPISSARAQSYSAIRPYPPPNVACNHFPRPCRCHVDPTCQGFLPQIPPPLLAFAHHHWPISHLCVDQSPSRRATALPTSAPTARSRRVPSRAAEWSLHSAAPCASLRLRCTATMLKPSRSVPTGVQRATLHPLA